MRLKFTCRWQNGLFSARQKVQRSSSTQLSVNCGAAKKGGNCIVCASVLMFAHFGYAISLEECLVNLFRRKKNFYQHEIPTILSRFDETESIFSPSAFFFSLSLVFFFLWYQRILWNHEEIFCVAWHYLCARTFLGWFIQERKLFLFVAFIAFLLRSKQTTQNHTCLTFFRAKRRQQKSDSFCIRCAYFFAFALLSLRINSNLVFIDQVGCCEYCCMPVLHS